MGDEEITIGFFPCSFSLGETIPHIKIANIFKKKGFNVIFFSRGGKFEKMLKSFTLVKLSSLSWEDAYTELDNYIFKEKMSSEKLSFYPYLNGKNENYVKEEIRSFKKANIDFLISSFNPTCSISARVAKVPLFILQSGTSTIPFIKQGNITFPENYEFFITRLLPSTIKNYITRWFLLHNRLLVKDFNIIAKKYELSSFRTIHDILKGDYNLVCDDINFLGVTPTQEYPLENFVGPIFGELLNTDTEIDKDILNHINKQGKSIFVNMGSNRSSQLFLNILTTLNDTDYNIIVVNHRYNKGNNLPKTNNNILVKSFIHSPRKLHELVDLSIIHGGRGTVYAVAYSGKPAIGFPNHVEQQHNLDGLVRNGMTIRLSKKHYHRKHLLNSLHQIFDNYDYYHKNAKMLSKKLTKIPGEEKAARRIIEIYNKISK